MSTLSFFFLLATGILRTLLSSSLLTRHRIINDPVHKCFQFLDLMKEPFSWEKMSPERHSETPSRDRLNVIEGCCELRVLLLQCMDSLAKQKLGCLIQRESTEEALWLGAGKKKQS